MKLEKTTELLYQLCADRVKNKIKDSDLTLEQIYPNDPKLISRIQNNKRYNGNRFLLTDTVIMPSEPDENAHSNIGLVPLLFKSKDELLWGTVEEFTQNLYPIFESIILDLLDASSEIEIDINYILSDYVPYAENYAYWHLLYECDNKYPAILYGISEDKITNNREKLLSKAIKFLYKKCNDSFFTIFINFTVSVRSYKKLDSVLYKEFIIPLFIPMLKKYIPTSSSLGIRARELILSDLSSAPKLILEQEVLPKSYQAYYRILNNASSAYILKLAKAQKLLIDTM